jgi:hypothetical protein
MFPVAIVKKLKVNCFFAKIVSEAEINYLLPLIDAEIFMFNFCDVMVK